MCGTEDQRRRDMGIEPAARGSHRVDSQQGERINLGSELPEALRGLIERSPLRQLSAGETLIHPGEPQDRIWWLQSGRLRSFSLGEDGSEFNHDFVGPQEWACGGLQFGPDSCCVEPGLGLAALSISQVRVLGLDALQRLRSSDAPSADFLFRQLLQVGARRLQREADLVHRSAQQRYLALLQQQPEIEGELSQKQIAQWLGITPVALSRIRRRCRQASAETASST